jgi:hypothetical protein
MDKSKRIKRSEATWREIFSRHVSSGLSVLEFCRAEGINPGVFRRWRSVFNEGIRVTQNEARTKAKVAPFIDIVLDIYTAARANAVKDLNLDIGS